MGCNTSKESIQQAIDEAKEETKDLARQFMKKEVAAKNEDISNSKDIETTIESFTKSNEPLENDSETEKKKKEEDSEDGNNEEKAATRIQAIFRGHRVRTIMKNTESSANQGQNAEREPTKEQFEQEFRVDDKDLCHAATKIQATFRGHMSRKVDQAASVAKGLVGSAAEKIEEKMAHAASELEGIDLSDPDLHKAATKIQASFRGHKVRQEVVIPNVDEKK